MIKTRLIATGGRLAGRRCGAVEVDWGAEWETAGSAVGRELFTRRLSGGVSPTLSLPKPRSLGGDVNQRYLYAVQRSVT